MKKKELAHSSTRSAAFLDGGTLRKEQNVFKKTMESERKISGNILFIFHFGDAYLWKHSAAVYHENRAPLFGMEKMEKFRRRAHALCCREGRLNRKHSKTIDRLRKAQHDKKKWPH